MVHRFAILTASLFTLVAVAACSDDTESGNPTGPTLEEAGEKTIEVRCAASVACGLYESDAECRASVLDTNAQYEASVEAGRVKYHPEKLQACLDGLKGVLEDCSISDLFGAPSKANDVACAEAFEPTVADGGKCYASLECISQSCTLPCIEGCCEGTCAPSTRAKIGESCANGETCEDNAYCQTDDMGNPTTCAAQVDAGGACTSFDQCKLPSFCALDFMTGMGTCVVPAAHDATCDQKAVFKCDRLDDYCDPTTNKCTTGKAIGEACPMGVQCIPYATCDAGGMCKKKPGEGGTCDPMSFAECLGDLQCEMDGTCKFPATNACP
ncbi:hypothetical protein [Polyangium sp. y55x31]|uniref:hypothetical protein n=1 Tax=Polyangium sp. y55x31 TaxID=3042688 RepID=UPI0024825B9C|nr:hypothetical protein [Polyangium sp. y55x31]MDI1483780.1 hypothetical protein [Polyangium sp. y55x31]